VVTLRHRQRLSRDWPFVVIAKPDKQGVSINDSNIQNFDLKGCCNYGSAGTLTKAYDCLNIPGAEKTTGIAVLNNFCGGKLATAAGGTANKTICSKF